MSVDDTSSDDISIERRGDGIAGIWIDGTPLGKIVHSHRERIEDLEAENERLRDENDRLKSEIEDAKNDAELALAVAGETADHSRADGGPTKVKRAEHLSRNEVVRQAATSAGGGGSVTASDVVDMAKPKTNLHHRTVVDAWEKLETRWDALHVQERDDAANRLVANRDGLGDDLVQLVDDDLSDTEVAERLHRGRT